MLNDLCNNLYDTWAYLMVIREQYTNTKTAGVIWTFIRVRTCGASVPRLDELWGQHLNKIIGQSGEPFHLKVRLCVHSRRYKHRRVAIHLPFIAYR